MTADHNDPPAFYRAHVFCCVNVRPPGHERGCCSDKGSVELRDYMKQRAKELGRRQAGDDGSHARLGKASTERPPRRVLDQD